MIRNRLKRLEQAARIRTKHRQADWRTEEEWLALFECWERDGHFDHWPAFGKALHAFRPAMARAMLQTDPPFDPPASFKPGLPPMNRYLVWRTENIFPGVESGLLRLLGIAEHFAVGQCA